MNQQRSQWENNKSYNIELGGSILSLLENEGNREIPPNPSLHFFNYNQKPNSVSSDTNGQLFFNMKSKEIEMDVDVSNGTGGKQPPTSFFNGRYNGFSESDYCLIWNPSTESFTLEKVVGSFLQIAKKEDSAHVRKNSTKPPFIFVKPGTKRTSSFLLKDDSYEINNSSVEMNQESTSLGNQQFLQRTQQQHTLSTSILEPPTKKKKEEKREKSFFPSRDETSTSTKFGTTNSNFNGSDYAAAQQEPDNAMDEDPNVSGIWDDQQTTEENENNDEEDANQQSPSANFQGITDDNLEAIFNPNSPSIENTTQQNMGYNSGLSSNARNNNNNIGNVKRNEVIQNNPASFKNNIKPIITVASPLNSNLTNNSSDNNSLQGKNFQKNLKVAPANTPISTPSTLFNYGMQNPRFTSSGNDPMSGNMNQSLMANPASSLRSLSGENMRPLDDESSDDDDSDDDSSDDDDLD